MIKRVRNHFNLLTGCLVATLLVAGAQPASAIWQGASSGDAYVSGNTYDYDATGNWVGASIDDSFSSFALTGPLTVSLDLARTTVGTGLNLTYNGDFDLTLASNNATPKAITLGGDVTADAVDGSRLISIGISGRLLTLNLNNAIRTFSVGSGDTLIANGVISSTVAASGGITKTGSGILLLNAANTYTGLTQVDNGELRWGIASALSSGNLTINSGGTVNMQTFADTVGTVTLNAGGVISGTTGRLTTGAGGLVSTGGTIDSGFTTGGVTLGGTLDYNTDSGNETTLLINGTFNGGASRIYDVDNGVQPIDVDIQGVLQGTTSLTKNGTGTMRIGGSAANSLATATTVVNDGELILANSSGGTVIGSGAVTVGNSVGAAGSAILRYSGFDNQIQNSAITVNSDGLFDLNGRSETTSGALTLNSGGQITIGAGSLTTGAAGVTGSITATGAGTYSSTAGITVNSGGSITTAGGNVSGTTITVNNGGSIATGGGTLTGTGALVLNGTGSITTGGGNFNGTTTLTSTGGGTINAGAGVYTMNGNLTYTAGAPNNALVITANQLSMGAAGRTFTVADEGTQVIDVDIQAELAATAAATVTKAGPGTLRLGGDAVSTLGTGGLTLGASTGKVILNNSAGNVVGSGTVTIGASSTVQYGSYNNQLNDASAIANSGTLDLNGRTDTAGALAHNAGASILLGGGSLTVTTATTFSGTMTGDPGSSFTTSAGNLTLGVATSNIALNNGDVTVNGALGISNAAGSITTGGGDITVTGGITTLGTINTGGGNLSGTTLSITGASINTGAGTYNLGGNVTGNSAVTTATIAGNLDLGAATRTFTIADNLTANPDMDVTAAVANGTLSKAGTGQLRLSGTTANTAAAAVSAGTLLLGKTGANAVGSSGLTVSGAGNATWEANDQIDDSAVVTASGGTVNLQANTDTVGTYRMSGAHTISGTGTLTAGSLEATTATTQTGTTPTLAMAGNYTGSHAAGSATWNAAIALAAGTHNVNQAAGGTSRFDGTISGGSGAVNVNASADTGTIDVRGVNTYGGGTTVSAGTLLVNNSAALGSGTGSGNVVVNSGGTLGGYGKIDGQVSGTGTIAPGQTAVPSANILTVGSINASAGTDFSFELNSGSLGSGTFPVWNAPTASLNDVLHVSSGGLGTLTSANTITVDFTGSEYVGQKFHGAFFTSADHLSSVSGATWNYTGLGAGATVTRTTTAVTGANFADGTVNGFVDTFQLGVTGGSTVYVSAGAAPWSGSGTLTDPYGSIQEAYASLWGTAGNHTIQLFGGTYTGDAIGANPWGNGLIDFTDGGGGAGGIVPSTRGLNTFTLTALSGPGTVTIDRDTTAGQNPLPAGGGNSRGLFSTSNEVMVGMFVSNLDIRLSATGAALIGKTHSASLNAFTFQNVNLFLGPDAGLVVNHGPSFENASYVFDNSNIYFDPDSGLNVSAIAGQSQGSVTFSANLINGNNTSRIWTWNDTGSFYDPSQYTILTDLTQLYMSQHNPSTFQWAQNGSNAIGNNANSNYFMNYFLTTLPPEPPEPPTGAAPEPTTIALLALGAGLVVARRRKLA